MKQTWVRPYPSTKLVYKVLIDTILVLFALVYVLLLSKTKGKEEK